LTFILDTSVAIPLRDGDKDVKVKLRSLVGTVAISAITRVELEGGVYADPRSAAVRRRRLDLILAGTPTLDFTEAAAVAYDQIVAASGFSRRKIIDRMIAAQAIVHRATLVTLNPTDFSDMPGLSSLAL